MELTQVSFLNWGLGLINEQINWKERFFVSTNEIDGIDILTALLDHCPIGADSETEPESQVSKRR